MRGKEGITDAATKIVGITPAYAGKSKPSHGRCYPWGDHPRLCGEKVSMLTV